MDRQSLGQRRRGEGTRDAGRDPCEIVVLTDSGNNTH